MCGDSADRSERLSRRGFLVGSSALVAAAALRNAPAARAALGRPVSMAMHIHGSFSEDRGSWDQQAKQAVMNGVDVLWATDHDWRMSHWGFLTHLSMTSDVENGVRLQRLSGSGATGPSGLSMTGASYRLDSSAVRYNTRGNLSQLTITVDAVPNSSLQLRVVSSRHPVGGTLPMQVTKTITTTGTVSWRPGVDLANRVAPGLAADFSLYDLFLEGTGTLSNLQLDWGMPGQEPLTVQAQVLSAVNARYATEIYQALEPSLYEPHVNWFGGSLMLPSYAGKPAAGIHPDLVSQMVQTIHSRGGLASYNHPYGTHFGGTGVPLSTRQQVARDVLSTNACGADLLEVAYPARNGANIDDHLFIWDACSRNSLYLVGTGVSDDHTGLNWNRQSDRFITCAWSASTAQSDLLTAMRGGRLFARKLSNWAGSLDMTADGSVPMGTVSPSLALRTVRVQADQVPAGGVVQLLAAPIDNGGVPVGTAEPVATWSGTTVDSSTTVPAGSFFRAQVKDSDGIIVGVGNPIWSPRSVAP